MKSRKIFTFFICISVCFVYFAGISPAQAQVPPAEEAMLFTTTTAPDVLILQDLSASMNENIAIVKQAIFSALDGNGDGVIDSKDEGSLAVRVGFMRFRDGNDTAASWSTGNSKVVCAIGSSYSRIFCANGVSCASTVSSCGKQGCTQGGGAECVVGETTAGGRPLAMSLYEAKLYLDAHKAVDTYAACREKFVILIAGGSDTYACGGDDNECKNSSDVDYSSRYKGRREVVAQAKALADAGYKVFVVGVGANMPTYLQNTLNWAAYYGGTDDPASTNNGSTTGYAMSASCNHASNREACYPAGVGSSCVAGYTPLCCRDETVSSMLSGTCGGTNYSSFYAPTNDPGNTSLSGYAFLATNADALTAALKTVMSLIHQATFSFTQASVQASRTADENYLYEASFDPIDNDPFWHGHLKKFQILDNGDVGSMVADAGDVLLGTNASSRNMNTVIGGAITPFIGGADSTISPTYFGYAAGDTPARDAVIEYIRGVSSANPDQAAKDVVYKLGDVFRSTPVTIGTPSAFYDDNRDINYSYTCGSSTAKVNAFAKHRCDNCRAASCPNTKRIIVAGANDGQLHAFRTSDMSEAWSFIPPNLLVKLNTITHSQHPANQTHGYFVDGPVTVADVWLGDGDGKSKQKDDWKSVLMFGEGRGSDPNLWSSSPHCDSGFSPVYSASYPYYCGFYALNVTDTPNPPLYMWHLGGASALASDKATYLGDPWSRMMPGKVLIGGKEKWVGFIGGGYNGNKCPQVGTCDTRGKGFFIVDLKDGSILKSFTHANDTRMIYSIPAAASILDADNDGFIDTAYIGDLGGNIWRIKLCTRAEAESAAGCTESDWKLTLFYNSASGQIRPIYTTPAAAVDGAGNLWIYWGTGDKNDPTAANAQEQFYALKDNDRTTTYTINDMENITTGTYDNTTSTKAGYYITIGGMGEKILADPIVFGGVVYFTTYKPPANQPCEQTGTASLFGIRYTSGAGAFPGGKSVEVGQGIPSGAVVSTGHGSSHSDLYITTSSGGTSRVPFNPPGGGRRTNMLFWRDQRLQ